MKKKNVIGHMEADKNLTEKRFRQLHLLPRFLCLLIAVIIWLCVVNLNAEAQVEPDGGEPIGAVSETAGK